jgi:hypothetical protein
METRTLFAPLGEQLSLLDYAFGNPIPSKPPVANVAARIADAPVGQYLIRSESERGYWCNDFGWVFQRDAATGFCAVNASAATIRRWHPRGEKGLKKDKHGSWYWIARQGGLGGHRGADFDGPFRSAEEAALDAIGIAGVGAPVMETNDATYVHYDDARDFSMNA